MTIGDLIRTYRKDHGLSQRQFAINCGLSNGYISMLEKGENPKTKKPVTPTLHQLKKLADGMGMTIMEMLDAVDDMPVDISAEAMILSNEKTSAPTNESGRNDSIDYDLASLILQLSPEKKQEAIKYLRYLVDRADD